MPTWNHGGPKGHLYAAGRRFGDDPVPADRLSRNDEMYKLNTILCGLAENHRESLKAQSHSGLGFSRPELAHARDTLANADKYNQRVVVMLLAGMEMVDTAAAAYGIDAPDRPYCVLVQGEADPHAALIASLRAEVERLAAENAAMAEQLTSPAGGPEVGSGTSPVPPAPIQPKHKGR